MPQGVPPPPARPPPMPGAAMLAEAASEAERLPLGVEFWICLDFEWTCDEGEKRQVRSDEGEIIEFSFVVYDAKEKKMACQGQHYCKNLRTPITEFCTSLTGISDVTLKDAGTLQDAVLAFNKALDAVGATGRSCCAVAHGSADLELVLPSNCKALGIEVPRVLQRYVDLREATQSHLAAKGTTGVRASSLKQICDALNVQMIGEEHCGLDDSWMVLLATQQLIEQGALLRPVDLVAEREAFLATSSPERSLCLDGLPYFCVGSELGSWMEQHAGEPLAPGALSIVLGMDGKPSGRALVDFGSHEAAGRALTALDGGRRIVCGTLDTWPFEHPKERLILARPLREQERLLRRRDEGEVRAGPALAPFPADAAQLEVIRRGGKGSGRGRERQPVEPAEGCEGSVKFFNEEKGFGFITYPGGEVFVHRNFCEDGVPTEGQLVRFDVVRDKRNGKTKAANVRFLSSNGSGGLLQQQPDGGKGGGKRS